MSRPEVADFRLAAGVRLFALVALAAPVLISSDIIPIVGLVILALIWMTGLASRGALPTSPLLIITFEAIAVGVTLGADLDQTLPLFGALAVAPLAGGVQSGFRGVAQCVMAETASVLITTAQLHDPVESATIGTAATWLIASAGFGFVAAFVGAVRKPGDDALTPYRDARALISQLLDLSGKLSDGLDPVSISQRVMTTAREDLPFVGGVVYVRRGQDLTPLIDSAENAGLDTHNRERLVEQAWQTRVPVVNGPEIAFPLLTDAGVVAVVAAGLPPALLANSVQIDRELQRLSRAFRAEALRLDTALLFAAVRDEATAEERRRLAREVHDGVAQDVASLGYLVDDLEAAAETTEQAELFRKLRGEITTVVAELRRSVFSLRNDTSAAGSLGESIGALARHITTVTGIPVHVSLDEGSTRLRPEVEAELLRIAQEGINNAVRHSQGHNIWVDCQVAAPSASVVVRDDGRGLQAVRHDSHGLRIMEERARLIGATLELRDAEPGGTELRVTIDRAPA